MAASHRSAAFLVPSSGERNVDGDATARDHGFTKSTVAYSPAECPIPLIFVAEGPALKIYEQTDSGKLSTAQVFIAQSIHGISLKCSDPCGTRSRWLRCALWGGRSIRILDVQFRNSALTTEMHLNFLEQEIETEDWILHATLSPLSIPCDQLQERHALACFVTAHNELRILLATSEDGNLSMTAVKYASGASIYLYSAFCLWNEHRALQVVAGTVFGEVHVWRVQDHTQKIITDAEYMYTPVEIFYGHEGSVYGVGARSSSLDPACTLVTSCSDDRTVRAWMLNDRSNDDYNHMREQSRTFNHGQLISTGFPSRHIESIAKTGMMSLPNSHLSRIWLTQPFILTTGRNLILSAGEDAAVHIWDVAHQEAVLASEEGICLRPVTSFRRHTGKNIWAADIRVKSDVSEIEQVHIMTGGADGKVIDQSISFQHNGERSTSDRLMHLETDVNVDVFDSFVVDRLIQHGVPHADKECFIAYAFLDHDRFLASSRFGQIFSGKIVQSQPAFESKGKSPLDNKGLIEWQDCRYLADLQAPIAITRIPGYGALISGKIGKLYAYETDDSSIISLMDLKNSVSTIIPIEIITHGSRAFAAVIGFHGQAQAQVIRWKKGSKELLNENIFLELPSGFRLSAATWIQTLETLALGSRSGKLLLYSIESMRTTTRVNRYFDAPSMHGNDTITQLLNLRSNPCFDGPSAFLMSTGRDGNLKVHSIRKRSTLNDVDFQLIHQVKLPLGPDIESVCQHPVSKHILVWGFKSTDFVLWNYTTQTELMTVSCGGGHRNWAFMPNLEDKDGGRFAWTRASSLSLRIQTQAPQSTIQSGFHGREIKAIAIRPGRGSLEQPLIATGSEDTCIRIAEYAPTAERSSQRRTDLYTHCIMPFHITGIYQLHWSNDGGYLFSSGGAEQLLAWRVQAVPPIGIGIVLIAECPRVSEDGDLRVTDFSIEQSETNAGEPIFLIAAAYSDSTLRTWILNCHDASPKFHLKATGMYGSNCLSQVRLLCLSSNKIVLTASTDGRLAIWNWLLETTSEEGHSANVPAPLNVSHIHALHQSSLKSMDILYFKSCSDAILIATGGDDNALALTIMRSSERTPVFQSLLIPNAHAAAVTGLAWIQKERQSSPIQTDQHESSHLENHFLVSSSNDQTLRVWQVSFASKSLGIRSSSKEVLQIRRIRTWKSSIADISNLATMSHGAESKVVVVGVGMEVWDAMKLIHG